MMSMPCKSDPGDKMRWHRMVCDAAHHCPAVTDRASFQNNSRSSVFARFLLDPKVFLLNPQGHHMGIAYVWNKHKLRQGSRKHYQTKLFFVDF